MSERRAPSRRSWAAVTGGLLIAGLTLAVTVGAYGYDYEEEVADTGAAAAAGASAGVFTEEQRDQGEELFAANCAHCHGEELGGGMGPPLDQLGEWWGGNSLGQLFRFVRSNMPMDRPGSLEDEEYVAVIAFVLHHNGFPTGETPLPVDEEALDDIEIDELPSG